VKLKTSKVSTVIAGVSGEYFVAAELSKRGYIASITLRNTKGIDILATASVAEKTARIQVKTSQGKRRDWILNKKAESYYAPDLFYIFVALKSLTERPDYFIVPSKTVALFVKERHQKWLDTPGKKGQQHNDSDMRIFVDVDEKYLERWDLLQQIIEPE